MQIIYEARSSDSLTDKFYITNGLNSIVNNDNKYILILYIYTISQWFNKKTTAAT